VIAANCCGAQAMMEGVSTGQGSTKPPLRTYLRANQDQTQHWPRDRPMVRRVDEQQHLEEGPEALAVERHRCQVGLERQRGRRVLVAMLEAERRQLVDRRATVAKDLKADRERDSLLDGVQNVQQRRRVQFDEMLHVKLAQHVYERVEGLGELGVVLLSQTHTVRVNSCSRTCGAASTRCVQVKPRVAQ